MTNEICNPLNLPYRFQDIRTLTKRTLHREAADPSIVAFKGRFYLFVSMSGGFWHSDDLVSWSFRAAPELPAYDYAPDVREVDGYLYFCASRLRKGAFYRTTDPLHGRFEKIDTTFAFWDPNLFCDDDGRVYFYWGCSNRTPLYGVELDIATMTPDHEPVALITGRPGEHGWEQIGDDHDPQNRSLPSKIVSKFVGAGPFIEGAWMTKHDGTYYLQYAAPGTEFNTYADGYYTARSPLGPFTYSADSPFSSKPGGFITGAGHGSTFADQWGNWWHIATMRISVAHHLERRIGLFPAGFDEDGVLFCNQNFGDYPMVVPQRTFDPWRDTFAGWMLLSYRKSVTAMSCADGHGSELAVDEDVRTWWAADRSEPGQWLSVDLGEVHTVRAVQVNLAEHRLKRSRRLKRKLVTVDLRHLEPPDTATEFLLEASPDGSTWVTLRDTRGNGEDVPHDFVVLPEPLRARYIRITGYSMPYDGTFAVSGLRVFGHGNGNAPGSVTPTATRTDPLTAELRWAPVEDARGYNIRYGRTPRKLYHSWLVYDQNHLGLTGLNAGIDYYVAVDAFNENGITEGSPVRIAGPAG